MNQMQAFIEKAKNDKALMAKLDALGASGAEADKIIALAAEHGFSITEADCREAAAAQCQHKRGELAEEDLEAAAGGWTENRYDPAICSQYKLAHYNCVGFFKSVNCDHYREETGTGRGGIVKSWFKTCQMGYYSYVETDTGEIVHIGSGDME